MIAIDSDRAAIDRLAVRLAECGLTDKFTLVQDDLLSVRSRGDVVLFEFCLHEMPNPARALDHAAGLAPDVLVIDHAPESPWSWYADEERGVAAGWEAVARGTLRGRLDVDAFQYFRDYEELEAKMAGQGPARLERIGAFRGRTTFSIAMPYRLVLLAPSLRGSHDGRA